MNRDRLPSEAIVELAVMLMFVTSIIGIIVWTVLRMVLLPS